MILWYHTVNKTKEAKQWLIRLLMIAFPVVLVQLSALPVQFPKATASTRSMLTLVWIAALAQVYVLLALPLRADKHITHRGRYACHTGFFFAQPNYPEHIKRPGQ